MASPTVAFLKRLFRRKLVLAAACVLLVFILAALFAPWVAPYDPGALRVIRRLKPPSELNWLGTDEFGRDVLSRIVYGARASLGIGAAVVAISIAAGSAIGLTAGYFRRLDPPIMRMVDAVMALPDILLAIFLVAILGSSIFNVVFALAIVYTPRDVRVVRASALVVRELDYVQAARIAGAGDMRIMLRHILPNSVGPLLVHMSFVFAYSILAEAALRDNRARRGCGGLPLRAAPALRGMAMWNSLPRESVELLDLDRKSVV